MAKIRYTELFGPTIQGEGRYMGVPSIFLRTFGCPFKCAKFGLSPSAPDRNEEVEKVIELVKSDPERFKTLDDLPLVKTGCDSYPSVYPEFKSFAKEAETDDLVEEIVGLLPYKRWMEEHLVITGGEPLLGWQRAYPDLLDHPKMKELKEITFETNGTQKLSSEFKDYLDQWTEENFDREVTFSVSPKLSCSGEPREKAIIPSVVVDYQDVGYVYLKFVVSTEEDAKEAIEVADIYRKAGFNGPVYLMPIGGVEEVYTLNNKAVAELALKNGLRYSDRMHVSLYGNQWAT